MSARSIRLINFPLIDWVYSVMFEETSLAKHSQKANAEAAFTTISSY